MAKGNLFDVQVFHTNRGSEFGNKLVDELPDSFQLSRSLSMKGCPYDDALAESTFNLTKAIRIAVDNPDFYLVTRCYPLVYELHHRLRHRASVVLVLPGNNRAIDYDTACKDIPPCCFTYIHRAASAQLRLGMQRRIVDAEFDELFVRHPRHLPLIRQRNTVCILCLYKRQSAVAG